MAEVKITMVDIIGEDGSPRVALNIEADKAKGQVQDRNEPASSAEVLGLVVKRMFDAGTLSSMVPLVCADLVNAVHAHRKKQPKVFKPTANDILNVEKTKKG